MSEQPISLDTIREHMDSYLNAIISGDLSAIVDTADTIICLTLVMQTNPEIPYHNELWNMNHKVLEDLANRNVRILPVTTEEGTLLTYSEVKP